MLKWKKELTWYFLVERFLILEPDSDFKPAIGSKKGHVHAGYI